jgi:hypothetical protein
LSEELLCLPRRHPPRQPRILRHHLIHLLLDPFRNNLKNNKTDRNGDHPFHGSKGLFVDHGFFGGQAPEIFDAAGGEEMRYKACGGHADGKAEEVADKIAVEVLEEFPLNTTFHRY